MKVDINVKDKYGYTPLHVACLCNCKNEILELMLSYEGILVDVENEDGNTPMHYFCKCFLSPTCQEISKRMLELGADLNKQNKVQCFAQFPSRLSRNTLICCSVWGNATPQGHIEWQCKSVVDWLPTREWCQSQHRKPGLKSCGSLVYFQILEAYPSFTVWRVPFALCRTAGKERCCLSAAHCWGWYWTQSNLNPSFLGISWIH